MGDEKPTGLVVWAWLTLELIGPLLVVGAVAIWAVDKARGEVTGSADYRVVIAAAVIALAIVVAVYSRHRRRGRGAGTTGT